MLTTQEREYLLNSMEELLDEYEYNYSSSALNAIIDEWADQKEELIEAFKKHPNYVDGKFMIAFTQNYERELNMSAVKAFADYVYGLVKRYRDTLPEEIKNKMSDCEYLPHNLLDLFLYDFEKYFNTRIISEDTVKELDKILPQIHPHAGQKTSRVVNKICQYLNYSKDPDYNREFAKFADGLSPMIIKRHTVLSINPLDYLTMSFGNSWASCHTIDKHNKRDMPNDYSGCYSSGTISYMLDTSSMVFYTVDAGYDGNDYWTQPKINRQMFHYGEDKLVQSRLYPQDNDGDDESYAPYRNIVQSIISLIFDFPNLWKFTRGTDAASRYISSRGTHYEDYRHFGSCSLSRIKDRENENCFVVGATPICINCGKRHDIEDNINHCNAGRECEECGRIIEDEDDECWIGDHCYCRDCVSWCESCDEYTLDDTTYIESEGIYVCDYCLNEYYTYCEDCGQYYPNDDTYWIESEDRYVCRHCIDDYYCCDKCGEYFTYDNIIDTDGGYYCNDCYEPELEENEEEEE